MSNRAKLRALVVAILSSCCLCSASAFAQPSARDVLLLTLDGRKLPGRLESMSAGRIKLAGADSVPIADLLSIQWPQQPVERAKREPRILFANGDVASALPISLDEETLTARWSQYSAWPEIKVPLERLRGSILLPPEPSDERLKLFARIAQPIDKTDLVYLRNGDTIAGELIKLVDGKLTVKQAASETVAQLTAAQAFSFNPELTTNRKFSGPGAIMHLTDGSRLHGKNLRLSDVNSMLVQTAYDRELDVPLSALSSLQLFSEGVVYLSDVEPAAQKSQGYVGAGWAMRKDVNVQGGPLTLRGAEFAKGLGVHARSELTWKLDGKYRKFQSTIGVDDSAAGKGNVIFRVVVDDKTVFTSRPLTGTMAPVVIDPVDVTKARALTLVVEFSAGGDILDHADWCNACVIR